MTTYGYVRVSTDAQSTAMQLDAMRAAGVTEILADEGVSGATSARKRVGAAKLLAALQAGDTVVVYSISRFGRSARDLLVNLEDLQARGVKFRSLTEPFDMDHYMGKFMVTLLAAVAEMERAMTTERVKAGLASAKSRGVVLGRAAGSTNMTDEQCATLREAVAGGASAAKAARLAGVPKSTAQRWLKSLDSRAQA